MCANVAKHLYMIDTNYSIVQHLHYARLIMISEIELLQKWLVNHKDKELKISSNSRYGILRQVREYIINKYGNDVYNEIITGKKVIKNKKIKVLSYKPEPPTIQIPFSEPEHTEPLNNIETEIHNPEIHDWNEIVNSILGTYWDYVYVKENVEKISNNLFSKRNIIYSGSVTETYEPSECFYS
jgi:hypothetical protein